MNADQLERLEAEIDRAVRAIEGLRAERDDLRKQCESLQETVGRQREEVEGLKSDMDRLNSEGERRREDVRTRVESMLARLDSIGLDEKGS